MELPHFAEIGIIVAIATVTSFIIHSLRQPLLIAYIISGALVSPAAFNLVHSTDLIATFSELGVAFLLFIVGLNLNPKVIKNMGGTALFLGLGQVSISGLLGFGIGKLLGFSLVESLYLGIAFTFGSTIINVKLLSDKKALDTLYGRLSVGLLIIQDLIAVFLLLAISSLGAGASLGIFTLRLALKLFWGIAFVALITRFVFPKLLPRIARSQELLFIFSIGWLFLLGGLFQYMGISIEIGALVAGVSFSMLPYHYEIASRMRSLRDFFIILFFIFLGAQMDFSHIGPFILPAIAFSLFILLIKPIVVTALLGIRGYKKRTGFFTSLSVSHISEFSMIIVAMGVAAGHIKNDILSFVTLVGLITIAISTYFITHAEKIFPLLERPLQIFEKKHTSEKRDKKERFLFDVILFGFNRVGHDFVKKFKRMGKNPLVVDYNPAIISRLMNENIPCTYGDATDVTLLEDIEWKKVHMALSTINDVETNLTLLSFIRAKNQQCIIVVLAMTVRDAIRLYEAGAGYVLLPHILSAKKALRMIGKHGFQLDCFVQEKMNHLEHLKKFQYEF